MAAGAELYPVDGLIGDAAGLVASALSQRPGYQDVSTLRRLHRRRALPATGSNSNLFAPIDK